MRTLTGPAIDPHLNMEGEVRTTVSSQHLQCNTAGLSRPTGGGVCVRSDLCCGLCASGLWTCFWMAATALSWDWTDWTASATTKATVLASGVNNAAGSWTPAEDRTDRRPFIHRNHHFHPHLQLSHRRRRNCSLTWPLPGGWTWVSTSLMTSSINLTLLKHAAVVPAGLIRFHKTLALYYCTICLLSLPVGWTCPWLCSLL